MVSGLDSHAVRAGPGDRLSVTFPPRDEARPSPVTGDDPALLPLHHGEDVVSKLGVNDHAADCMRKVASPGSGDRGCGAPPE